MIVHAPRTVPGHALVVPACGEQAEDVNVTWVPGCVNCPACRWIATLQQPDFDPPIVRPGSPDMRHRPDYIAPDAIYRPIEFQHEARARRRRHRANQVIAAIIAIAAAFLLLTFGLMLYQAATAPPAGEVRAALYDQPDPRNRH